MREIKFRGYAVEEMVNSQWIEGFGVSQLKFAEHYAKEVGRDSDWWIYTESGDYRVDPKSIGQYTGLKDKNGKEIYEGDILRFTGYVEAIAAISFNPNIACYQAIHGKSSWLLFPETGIEIEVIGNIYKNPGLLEVKA